MKKSALLIILTFVLILTGCGKEKQVSCSMSKEFEVGYKLEAKVSGNLKDGNIESAKLKMTMTFDDEKLAQSSYENLQKEYIDDTNKVDINIKGKVITVTEDIEQSGVIAKQDFINAYQEDGYTCE